MGARVGAVDEVTHRGVRPDECFYNTAIMACQRDCDLQRALELLDKMSEAGLKPDEFSYTISACERFGN